MNGPFQPLPAPVAGLAVAAAGIEVVFQLGAAGMVGGPGAVGWRIEAIESVGFFEPVFRAMLVTRRPEAHGLARFASYPLVHLGAMHAVFGVALLLALGQAVSARLRPGALAAVMVAGALGGALAYGALQHGRAPLVGLYPVVYALIGAFSQGLLAEAGHWRARLAAFRLVAVLVAMQLLFRLGFGGGGPEWVGDLGGFVAGFALAFLAEPARLRRLRDRLRER